MNLRCLFFGHNWIFRSYSLDTLLIKKKYLEFITESKATCKRCGKEKIWRNDIPRHANCRCHIDVGGASVKSHKEGDLIVIDNIDIYEFSVMPLDDVDLPVSEITGNSYEEKPYSYDNLVDIKQEEEE